MSIELYPTNRRMIIQQPPKPLDNEKLRNINERIVRVRKNDRIIIPAPYTQPSDRPAKAFMPVARASRHFITAIDEKIKNIRAARRGEIMPVHAKIIAMIPTYESEDNIGLTIESLLLQSRPIDLIVVTINGPGHSDTAYKQALPYAREFDNVIVERPEGLAGKVNALNYAYIKYAHFGKFDFWLGIDADIECDPEMVMQLETGLINRPKAGCMMARYSFKVPDDMKGKSRSLVYGQRHEFAMTGIKHQLRNDTSEIAGGQATLFKIEALREAAAVTNGGRPWDIRSKVEDAELTRTMQRKGYTIGVSREARAWTGLMFTAHTWQKQRRKWQDGHLEDMLRDFHPVYDRRRWFDQIALGWNLLIRIMFAALLATSVALDQFVFYPIWLIPIGIAILQSLLVAIKVPDRHFGEIMRALLFLPGEMYYIRTLSVWLESVFLAFLNIKRDGWGNQARAESSNKRTAVSGWVIIVLAVLIPMAACVIAARFLPALVMSQILMWSWYVLTALTLGSTIGMIWLIMRMLRHFRTIKP